MKHFAGFLIGLLLALSLSARATTESAEAQAATPPFLYVLVAKQAKVIKGDGGDYNLVISKGDIDHVIEISEKPFKMANFISKAKIVETWKTGAGDFGKGITMKGSFLGANKTLTGVNIKSISKTADDMRFVFFRDGNAPVNLDDFGTLQSVTTVNYCCHPEGGSGEWLWGN